jgi:type VI secretion system secreted protein Hcp
MSFDTYLKLKGIDGESTAEGMTKTIEIFSFSFGASNPATIGPQGGGIGTGRVSISSLNLMKRTDYTSPALFEHCCTGKHIPVANLYCRKAGGKQGVFLELELTECVVESVQWSGSSGGDDVPTESVSLAFQKVKFGFSKQKGDGSMEPALEKIWDLTKVSTK